ncbi:hypothetical protein BHK98_05660 [Hornefia porci]|uniref:Orn/DAP/Arg decarboxylase 2 N-terminal domain-containing protein n=1 Tax=Hornefia porci TaxID=2652292 RepID=A0A1Q9JHG3_9FIRM|nr:hypothetical protein [Hornefia porci]OLR55594.1 hypothetical protein BHK98_05660 [Hornefia porci]
MNNIEFLKKHAPCYVYDRAPVIRNCSRLTTAIPQVKFLYSVKTNPFRPLLGLVRKQGFGADAASSGEVLRAEEAGMSRNAVFYSAPGKTASDIRNAYGKCVFIADSLHELELLNTVAAEHHEVLSVGIRVNPMSAFEEELRPSGFGVDEELLGTVSAGMERLTHLRIVGVHVHVRSQVLSTGQLEQYYGQCFELAVRAGGLRGIDIRFVNFGSGIGMVYDRTSQAEVDLSRLSAAFDGIRKRNAETLNAELYIETGRFIVGNAGRYYTPVVDIKESRGTKYLIVRNGLNGFARPAIAQCLKSAAGKYPEQGMEPLYTCGNEVSLRILNDETQAEEVTPETASIFLKISNLINMSCGCTLI